jgi:FKBP-type peptidyl-prolyl cis-trans isomerase (trigger factor)
MTEGSRYGVPTQVLDSLTATVEDYLTNATEKLREKFVDELMKSSADIVDIIAEIRIREAMVRDRVERAVVEYNSTLQLNKPSRYRHFGSEEFQMLHEHKLDRVRYW